MFVMILAVIGISAAVGLITKFILDQKKSENEITWKSFGITMAVVVLVVAPGSIKLGWELAKKNKITYNEYWNGWETSARLEKIRCERDGSCKHCYDCDPYTVAVPHTNCDSKGNCTTTYTYETHYHSCPYVNEETDYIVGTTLGDYEIASHRFPENPQSHRWRASEDIPDRVISSAGVGEPSFWRAVKDRLVIQKPGPVTARREYKNYIYASDRTILKQYSNEIERYKKLGFLPRISSGIFDFYLADKVYFVGWKPQNVSDWQSKLRYLNAAFGCDLQGDLHLVVVQDPTINSNPDAYVIALKTYWQNPAEFGKNAFSKNGTAVVLGTTDGKTVAWARAFTGMPMGNETMATAISSRLKGFPLSPDTLVGEVHGKITKESVLNGQVQVGMLGDIIYGISEPETRFLRLSMSGNHGGKRGTGFLYLMDEIQPASGQKWIIFVCAAIACSIGWAISVYFGIRKNYYRRWR